MEPSAKDRAMIDALVEVNERARNRRSWRRAAITAVLSIGALLLVPMETVLPQSLRLALAIAGILGLLGVLFFLSTRSVGRSGSSWWPWLWW
jgi:hypothetical protein